MRSAFVLLAAVACGGPHAGERARADLVIVGADIRTMDAEHPHATAVAVQGGRIAAVGDDASVRALVGPHTRVVELHGATVTPGLVDAHCHLYGLGLAQDGANLRGATSEADAVARVVEYAKTRPADEWLLGRGWDQNLWPGQQFPTRDALDRAVGDRPVVLRRIDGHALWASSRALAAAGVTAATQDPAGGRIERTAAGEPTGVLVDNAMDLVETKQPPASAATRERRILAAAKVALAAGITGVHEMGMDRDTAEVYAKLADRGALPLRVYAYLLGTPGQKLAPPPDAHGRFAMRGVKFFSDGALGSRGARLYDAYDDDPQNRGLWVTEPRELAAAVEDAVAAGWQVAIHAIGDAGVGSVLDAYAAAESRHPGDLRLRVEHLQILAPRDVAKLVATHAIASMQPTHATSDMPWAEARIGHERILGSYAWRTVLAKRVPLAFGSDFPIEEVGPLLGLYAAVTRQDAAGKPAGGWYPAQRMTLDEAIAAFTRGAAYAERAEARRGVIAPGRDADLTVFDRALAPDHSLLETAVEMTVVGGQIVYQRTGT